MKEMLKYFYSSIFLSLIGISIAGLLGWIETKTMGGVVQAVFIVTVLSLLEISISFENAVVNATVLKKMTPLWQHRFLTWGVLIAVFGMRLVCPLAIVCLSAGMDPLSALKFSVFDPKGYSEMMLAVHPQVSAFGGSFLAMAALKYFLDAQKEVHWISAIESPLAKIGRLESIETALILAGLWIFSRGLEPSVGYSVVLSGVAGVATYILVDSIAELLKSSEEASGTSGAGKAVKDAHKASIGMFLYLEVLDASFSFDGVVGAFAISDHLFFITIGLGVGALFVRSLTIMMVDKGTLEAFKFLEHGAFWAVGSLAAMMFISIYKHVPETITAGVGIVIIALSIWSSISEKKKREAHLAS